MDGEFAFCDHCGSKVAIRYRNALTGQICWVGKNRKAAEVDALPDADADTFDWICWVGKNGKVVEVSELPDTIVIDWLCGCGHTTAVKDRARIFQVDFHKRRRRGGSD